MGNTKRESILPSHLRVSEHFRLCPSQPIQSLLPVPQHILSYTFCSAHTRRRHDRALPYCYTHYLLLHACTLSARMYACMHADIVHSRYQPIHFSTLLNITSYKHTHTVYVMYTRFHFTCSGSMPARIYIPSVIVYQLITLVL